MGCVHFVFFLFGEVGQEMVPPSECFVLQPASPTCSLSLATEDSYIYMPMAVVVVGGRLIGPDTEFNYHRIRLASPTDEHAANEMRNQVMKMHAARLERDIDAFDDVLNTDIMGLASLRDEVICAAGASSIMIPAGNVLNATNNQLLKFQLIARLKNVTSWKPNGCDKYKNHISWELDAIFFTSHQLDRYIMGGLAT